MKILFSLFVIVSSISVFAQETNQNSAVVDLYLNGEVIDGSNRTLSGKAKNLITVDGAYYDSFRLSCSGCLMQEKDTGYLITPRLLGSMVSITVSGVKGEKQYALYTQSMLVD